jgi:hypothetical protein
MLNVYYICDKEKTSAGKSKQDREILQEKEEVFEKK